MRKNWFWVRGKITFWEINGPQEKRGEKDGSMSICLFVHQTLDSLWCLCPPLLFTQRDLMTIQCWLHLESLPFDRKNCSHTISPSSKLFLYSSGLFQMNSTTCTERWALGPTEKWRHFMLSIWHFRNIWPGDLTLSPAGGHGSTGFTS